MNQYKSIIAAFLCVIASGLVTLGCGHLPAQRGGGESQNDLDLPKFRNPRTGTGTSTPLLVRGGAMTILTTPLGNQSSSKTEYCFDQADTSYIELDGFSLKSDGSKPFLDNPILNLGGPDKHISWSLLVFGSQPSGSASTAASTNGLWIQANPNGCSLISSSTNVIDILVFSNYAAKSTPTVNAANALLYPADLTALPNGYKANKRFHDITGTCPSDSDSCERVSEVDVYVSDSSLKKPDSIFYCPYGNCSIKIGQPQ